MDVWMTWSKREVQCRFCPDKVDKGTPVVVTRSVKTWEERTFTRTGRYHPQCWVNQGLAYLEKHPVVYKDGRPRLVLTPDQRVARMRLLRRRATLMLRYRRDIAALRIVEAVGHYIKAVELIPLMEPLGGVPRSWLAEVPTEEAAT